MNILPQNTKEFLSKKYWDKFFGKLKEKGDGNEFFEWYGNYKNFSSVIPSIIKSNDSILNIGCGKSLFSEDMYDEGYKQILNVDYSESVVSDMNQRAEGIRPELKYEVIDIFNMEYQDNQFSTILDKGCLDAIYPQNTEEITEKVDNLFEGLIRVGKDRYTLVSLLQEHIIKKIVDFFGRQKKFQISIHEVLIQNSKLYPFLVNIEFKPCQSETVNLTLKGEKTKVVNYDQCIDEIRKVQLQNNFMSSVKKLRSGQRFKIDLWDASNNISPKYTLNIVDSVSKKILDHKSCGCFIVPQGKENGFLFGTEKGNFHLLEQTNQSRLIIAILNPGFQFDSLDSVQNELSPAIQDLIPKGCSNSNVPFMTDGDEIGEKGILYQNDELIVEEIILDEEVFRRLILKSNVNLTQSQFKLGYHSQNNANKQYLKDVQSQQCMLQQKNKMWIGIDDSYLDFEAHRA